MTRPRPIMLGITAYGGAAACCLMRGGAVVVAAEEASFTRVACDASFPARAIEHCLAVAGIGINDVTLVVIAGAGEHGPAAIEDLRNGFAYDGACETVDRATAHAACAFLFSPFTEAAVMTIDARGSANYFLGRGTEVTLLGGWTDPSAAVRLLDAVSDELGLDGDRTFELLGIAEGGRDAWTGRLGALAWQCTTPAAVARTLRSFRGYSPTYRADFARSAQRLAEIALDSAVAYVRRALGKTLLCASFDAPLAALADRIPREAGRVFVAPANDAAAVAMGAASLAHARATKRRPASVDAAIVSAPAARSADVARLLDASPLVYSDFRGDEADLLDAVTDRLAIGHVVAWHQGPMDVGGRMSEGRLLLVSPQRSEYVDNLRAIGVVPGSRRRVVVVGRPRHLAPSDAAPPSAVEPRPDGRLACLLRCFEERTGCGHLVAASLRAGDEPTACSPEDALRTFARARIATLVVDDFLVDRAHLPLEWAHRIANDRPPHSSMVVPSLMSSLTDSNARAVKRLGSAHRATSDAGPSPSQARIAASRA